MRFTFSTESDSCKASKRLLQVINCLVTLVTLAKDLFGVTKEYLLIGEVLGLAPEVFGLVAELQSRSQSQSRSRRELEVLDGVRVRVGVRLLRILGVGVGISDPTPTLKSNSIIFQHALPVYYYLLYKQAVHGLFFD